MDEMDYKDKSLATHKIGDVLYLISDNRPPLRWNSILHQWVSSYLSNDDFYNRFKDIVKPYVTGSGSENKPLTGIVHPKDATHHFISDCGTYDHIYKWDGECLMIWGNGVWGESRFQTLGVALDQFDPWRNGNTAGGKWIDLNDTSKSYADICNDAKKDKPVINGDCIISDTKVDMVNHPKHYEFFEDMEAIEVIVRTSTLAEWRGYCRGNKLKYRLRVGKKDDIKQELGKSDKYDELYHDMKRMCIDAPKPAKVVANVSVDDEKIRAAVHEAFENLKNSENK